MTELAKKGLLFLMSEDCFDNYFLEHNFFDVPCSKALLSKGLGLGIIAGSILVKVPQILKLLANKSGEGINLYSVVLDLIAITFHLSYSYIKGFPFSAWGDSTFLAMQTAIIAALVLLYNGSAVKSAAFLAVYSTIVYTFTSGLVSVNALTIAQSFNIPILLVGKLSQAFTNFQNKSTGQLSAATCFMLFAGSLARIFTSIQETGDRMLIITFIVSTLANGVIVAQLLYYWNVPAKGQEQPAKARKPKTKKAD